MAAENLTVRNCTNLTQGCDALQNLFDAVLPKGAKVFAHGVAQYLFCARAGLNQTPNFSGDGQQLVQPSAPFEAGALTGGAARCVVAV
jgi:hypothetical protein